MKELTKHSIALVLISILMGTVSLYAQNDYDDYINSSPDKKEFSEKQWKKLKGKMKSESSGKSGNGENFNSSDYSTADDIQGESDGDFYDYEEEDYKGEYSEYQNYDDYENQDYEYDEYDDYDSYSNDNYYYEDPDKSEKYEYYEKPVEKEKTSSKSHRSVNRDNSSVNVGSGALSFMQVLLIIIGVVLLAFLIYYLFMRYQSDNDGATVSTNFDDMAPSEIPKTELERRLEEALGRGDYREAVRIYFIFIIKDLSNKRWISWEKRKTNISYLIEMRSRPQYDLFNKSVSVFEVVWYGNYSIDKKSFEEVEPTFKKLLESIHK